MNSLDVPGNARLNLQAVVYDREQRGNIPSVQRLVSIFGVSDESHIFAEKLRVFLFSLAFLAFDESFTASFAKG